jgi:hypothetical protein
LWFLFSAEWKRGIGAPVPSRGENTARRWLCRPRIAPPHTVTIACRAAGSESTQPGGDRRTAFSLPRLSGEARQTFLPPFTGEVARSAEGGITNARKLTQAQSGRRMDVSQPEVSCLFKGHFREYSIERLMGSLTTFDRDVEIVVRPHKRVGKTARITFAPGEAVGA